MNFCKNIFFLILFLTLTIQNIVKADDEKKSLVDEEELPLNNPFDGTQGSNSAPDSTSSEDSSVSELDNPMSLYNFKLAGIISGSKHSYISLVNQDGNSIILQLEEELYEGFRLIDLKLNEAIFKKADNSFVTINFKNQIKEVNEY
jgi:hypothetical protein|tara:strand:- start:687 stop:1124 length:438 start_codon:yes stop_codon:yes gene_type:complete